MESDTKEGDVADPRNAWKIVDIWVGGLIDHPPARTLAVGHPTPNWREPIPVSGGAECLKNQVIIFKGADFLLVEIQFDTFGIRSNVRMDRRHFLGFGQMHCVGWHVVGHPIEVIPKFIPGLAKLVVLQPEHLKVVFIVKSTMNIAHIRLGVHLHFWHRDLAKCATFRKWLLRHRIQAIKYRLHPSGFNVLRVADLIPTDFFLVVVFDVDQFGQRDDIIILKETTVF